MILEDGRREDQQPDLLIGRGLTDGETRPFDGWRGDTLLARIRWSRPNRLAST